MTVRFGVKYDHPDEGWMTVRAVEHGRRIAEVTFYQMPYQWMYDTYWELMAQGEQLNLEAAAYDVAPGSGDGAIAEAARIERCGLAYEEMEHQVGRVIDELMIVEEGETEQLDIEELARFWRVSVIAAGRRNAGVLAPACTWRVMGMSFPDPRLAKAWKLDAFRAGVFVNGPAAFMQPALAAAPAANPIRRLFSHPDHRRGSRVA